MARNAIVATPAITMESRITMNQAARLAAWGEGWVIPMVLIKAFAMSRMKFIVSASWRDGSRICYGVNRATSSRIYTFVLAGAVAGAYT
jgi:hypothetical protein